MNLSGGFEGAFAFLGRVEASDVADCAPEAFNGANSSAPKMSFELCKGHLDGVQIGRVRRQEQEPSSPVFDGLFGFRAFMGREIVEDHDIAFFELRRELGLDIDLEGEPVHRAIENPGSGQAVNAQACDQGLGFPMTERRVRFQPLPHQSPAPQPGHFRGCAGFIEKDQPFRLLLHAGLAGDPDPPLAFHILAFLFGCHQRFF